MAAIILDGIQIATEIRAEVAAEVKALTAAGIRPGLAVVLAGHNPASEIYVRGKVKSCEDLGMLQREAHSSRHRAPPESCWSWSTISTGVTRLTASWCSCRCPPRWTARKS